VVAQLSQLPISREAVNPFSPASAPGLSPRVATGALPRRLRQIRMYGFYCPPAAPLVA